MSKENFDATVARLAARQFGVFSREQAFNAGATKDMIHKRLTSGRWVRVHHGVYAIAGLPLTWNGELFAALLSAGPGAVASHRAAARLWRFPDHDRASIEIIHPTCRSRAFSVHRTTLDRVDVTSIGGIPVTTAARTLIDVAAVTGVSASLDDALRRGLLTVPKLMRRIDALAGKGRRGIDPIRAAAIERGALPAALHSPLESKVYDLIVTAGLPRPVPQYELRLNGRRAFIDFAYPEARFGIEADGYRWHAGRETWQSDLTRRNAITALGWRILHVTDEDVHRRRDRIVAAIRMALAA